MRIVVFLGPTLQLTEAREILDGIFLPPAGQGDVLSALNSYEPDAIALIDGLFFQSLSTWHKEILFALSKGVSVYGASSMGALRAAETSVYGMIGVGKVYEWYASGFISDDDEVALAHSTAEEGYKKHSEPLVNIRATFLRAEREAVVPPGVIQKLLAIAKSLYFPIRSFEEIFRLAGTTEIKKEHLGSLGLWLKNHYIDVKKDDAVQLLKQLADLKQSETNINKFEFSDSYLFTALYNRDRTVLRAGTNQVSLSEIAECAALHLEEFRDVNEAALHRALVLQLASLLGVGAEDHHVAAEENRFRHQRELATPQQLDIWIKNNDLTHEEYKILIKHLAVCRRMREWFLTERFLDRNIKPLLDELRVRGIYPDSAERAATQRCLADALQEPTEPIDLAGLVEEQRWHGWCPSASLSEWSFDAGFRSIEDLRSSLMLARRARQQLQKLRSILTDE